jgi:curli biogenesis system outer membrane secretion channel CsgG
MKLPINRIPVLAVALLLCATIARAQDSALQIKQIGIGEVTPTRSVREAANVPGQAAALNKLTDSLNEHLLVEFQRVNKFKVVVKQDLARILEDQGIPTGIIRDPSDRRSLPGKIKGLDYLVLCTVTDFKDLKSGLELQGVGMRVDMRVVQATVILKIYDTTTGVLYSAIDIPMRLEDKGTQRAAGSGYGNNAVDDSMIEGVVKDIARAGALRVVDAVYPPKVAQVDGGVVYVNRGEGSGIELGQSWTVYATGAEIKDPDTGQVIGRQEVEVAEIRITDVLPTMSKGTIIGDNRGVATGAMLRFKSMGAPPPGMQR